MHLSRLIERVGHGERITIARNNKPVAICPQRVPRRMKFSPASMRFANIFERNGGRAILEPGETWRDFIDEGRQ